MEAFGDCINACDLLELSLMGKKFIWSKGNSASHIDFSSEWLKKFPSSFLCGFSKSISDRRLVHLVLDTQT